VGWNISRNVILIPLAMAAMFFKIGMFFKYSETRPIA
jgi:hypothetical protein